MDQSMGQGLYAVFIECRQGEQRAQWMLFPPALPHLGVEHDPAGAQRFIKRRMTKKGHRAKWSTTQRRTAEELEKKLHLELDQYESTEWVFVDPIVIELEFDDYLKVWEGQAAAATPYKALRHVEAVAKKRGYRLTEG